MNENHKIKICFGMTLFNRADYLPEAIESLLNQSFKDFRIIAIDDCSSDATQEIMRSYAERDNRILFMRNPTHEGMISTWRKAFFEAFERYRPEYFAWATDHDIWDHRWLERHLDALDSNPDSVLAYPSVAGIDSSGRPFDIRVPSCIDTHSLDFIDHLYEVVFNMRGAGYAVYGLFRTLPLLKAGVFRYVLLPDRLLVTEISAYGKFVHIPEVLWYRRFFGSVPSLSAIIKSQEETLFSNKKTRLYIETPFLSHVISLLINLVLDQKNRKSIYISRGLILAGLLWEKRRKYIIKEIDRLLSYHSFESLIDKEKLEYSAKFNLLIALIIIFQMIHNRNINEANPFYKITLNTFSLFEKRKCINHASNLYENHESSNNEDIVYINNSKTDLVSLDIAGTPLNKNTSKFGLQEIWGFLEEISKISAHEIAIQNELRSKLLKAKHKIEYLRNKSFLLETRIEQLQNDNARFKKEISVLRSKKSDKSKNIIKKLSDLLLRKIKKTK